MTEKQNIRAIALDLLIEINENGSYSHIMLRAVLEKYQYLEKRDRAFLTRLVEGTLERMVELDALLDTCSRVPVAQMKPLIRNLLRMSVYQIRYMDSVPDSAACNEAVKLARKRGFASLAGYVNGVLRGVIRILPDWTYPDSQEKPLQYLSLRYSMPEWIVTEWLEHYGFAQTEHILQGFLQEHPITIRTNLARCTPQELAMSLMKEGVRVRREQALDYAFSIENIDYIKGLSAFRDGWFYVQDISSMLTVELAAPKPGDYVIDVCAAPGGKSTHMAQKLQMLALQEAQKQEKASSEMQAGLVEARDLTPEKLRMIEENIVRQGLTNIKAVLMDATQTDPASVGKADILLCDLPCSGLGVLGQKKDIRYKMTPEKQQQLVQLQREILCASESYVKPGGVLIYSTCTIHCAENEDNVAWFLEKYPDFVLESQQQLLPGDFCYDGFFMARLVRKGQKYV